MKAELFSMRSFVLSLTQSGRTPEGSATLRTWLRILPFLCWRMFPVALLLKSKWLLLQEHKRANAVCCLKQTGALYQEEEACTVKNAFLSFVWEFKCHVAYSNWMAKGWILNGTVGNWSHPWERLLCFSQGCWASSPHGGGSQMWVKLGLCVSWWSLMAGF